jgi:hypothetical protein
MPLLLLLLPLLLLLLPPPPPLQRGEQLPSLQQRPNLHHVTSIP